MERAMSSLTHIPAPFMRSSHSYGHRIISSEKPYRIFPRGSAMPDVGYESDALLLSGANRAAFLFRSLSNATRALKLPLACLSLSQSYTAFCRPMGGYKTKAHTTSNLSFNNNFASLSFLLYPSYPLVNPKQCSPPPLVFSITSASLSFFSLLALHSPRPLTLAKSNVSRNARSP